MGRISVSWSGLRANLRDMRQSENDRRYYSCDGGRTQQELSRVIQLTHRAVRLRHDADDTLFEIRARNSGNASQRRSNAEFTRLQDALGVNLRRLAKLQYFFIARP